MVSVRAVGKKVRASWWSLVLALSVVACGGGGTEHTGPGGRNPQLGGAFAYQAESPYADVLLGCADLGRSPSSCSIGTLPPMGLGSAAPSEGDILDRLLVSHEWMGRRFETILESLPEALRRVLRPVTVIVIADDIRPSFYSAATGAIYIDPRHLWITSEEEETILQDPDYRAGYGSELRFTAFASYLDRGQPAFSRGGGAPRDLAGRIYSVATLLFHEGAHANDFLPSDTFASLESGETFFEATERLANRRLAERLVSAAPLGSRLWQDLGRVLYFGEDPDEAQRALTAEEVGFAFAEDGACDPYAYSSAREDLAMLFEQTMMKLHFGLDRLIGFASLPEGEGATCQDYVVSWGMSNRIAAPEVRPRAQLVADLLLGDSLEMFFEGLGAPALLTPGDDLCVDAESAASAPGWS